MVRILLKTKRINKLNKKRRRLKAFSSSAFSFVVFEL
jgi:hypothetical protein